MHNVTGIQNKLKIRSFFVIFFLGPTPGKGNRQDGMNQQGRSIKVKTFMIFFGMEN